MPQVLVNAKHVQPALGKPSATVGIVDDDVSVAYHAIAESYVQRLPRSIAGRAVYDVDIAFLGFHGLEGLTSSTAFSSELARSATDIVDQALGMKNLGLPKELSALRSAAAAGMLDTGNTRTAGNLGQRDTLAAISTKVVPAKSASMYYDLLEYYLGTGVAKTIYLPDNDDALDRRTAVTGLAELTSWWGRGRMLTLLDAARVSGPTAGSTVSHTTISALSWLAIYLECLPGGQYEDLWTALPMSTNNIAGKVARLVNLARAMNSAALAPRIREAAHAVSQIKALLAFTADFPLWTDQRRDAIAEDILNFEKASTAMAFSTKGLWDREVELITHQMNDGHWVTSSIQQGLDKDVQFLDDQYGPGLATAWLPSTSRSGSALDIVAERSLLAIQKTLLPAIQKATIAMQAVKDMGAFAADTVTPALSIAVTLPKLDEARIATAADQLPMPVGAPHIARKEALARIEGKFFTLISWAGLYDALVKGEDFITLHRPAESNLPGLEEILSLRFPISRTHLEGESADTIVVTDDFMARSAKGHVAFYGAFPAYTRHALNRAAAAHKDLVLTALASTFAVLVDTERRAELGLAVVPIAGSKWGVAIPTDGFAFGLKASLLLTANAKAFEEAMPELLTTPGLSGFALAPLTLVPKLRPSSPVYIESDFGLFLSHCHREWLSPVIVGEKSTPGAASSPKWEYYEQAQWTNRVLPVPSLSLIAQHPVHPSLFTKRYSRIGATVFGWRENLVGYLSPELLTAEPEAWLPATAGTAMSAEIRPDLVDPASFEQIQASSGADTSKGAALV